jgi:type IV pilus assembly protein PilV
MQLTKTRIAARCKAQGFTLLEVVVSVLIIAVGLLGIAKLQALAYASSGSANIRSLVAAQTAGLAASMHANRSYWAAGLAPPTITINGATITDATLGPMTATCTSGDGAPCLPTNLAAADLHTWAKALNAMLLNSSPITTINCPASVNPSIPLTCTIQVTWTEKAVGINTQAAQGTTSTTFMPTYTLFVEP